MNEKKFILLIFTFLTQISIAQKRDADSRSRFTFECLDSTGYQTSVVPVSNTNVAVDEFISIVPLWYNSKEHFTDVKDEDFEEWLKMYNHRVKYTERIKYVKVNKEYDNKSYILSSGKAKKYFDKLLVTGYSIGINLKEHNKVFENFFPEEASYFNIIRSPYFLNEVMAGKQLSEANPIKFYKAFTPLLIDDKLLNGRAIITFYSSENEKMPSYYYNGFMKNGLFDGEGLLLEYLHDGTIKSKRGRFSRGVFLETDNANNIIKKLLTKTYIGNTFGLKEYDSLQYDLYKENFYFVGNEEYSISISLRVYAKNQIYNLYLTTRNTASPTEPFEIIYADQPIKDYLSRKNLPFHAEKYDNYTGYKEENSKVMLTGNCYGALKDLVTESPITIYSRQTIDGDWKVLGTWKLIRMFPCDGNISFGVNLVNKDAPYMANGLAELIFNYSNLKFENIYKQYSEALSAIVNFAKSKSP